MTDPFEPNTTFHPEQFAAMRKVFEDIARETWFHDNEDNRRSLAVLVLRNAQLGWTNEYDLLEACHEIARERFRRP